jgi:hypothetical protein
MTNKFSLIKINNYLLLILRYFALGALLGALLGPINPILGGLLFL